MKADDKHTGNEFADVIDPQGLLAIPSGINGYSTTLLDIVDQVMALTSPSAWLLELVYGTLQVDPFQEVGACFAGDWSRFGDCVDLWRMVGEAHLAIATNLRRGNDLLDVSWDGNAADAAFVYFRELTTYLEAMDRTLQVCSQEYERLALKVWYAAKGLGVALQTAIDIALIMAIAAAAGGATAGTGFGPVVAAAVIAVQATRLVEVWNLIAGMLSSLEAAVFGAGGVVAKLTAVAEHLPRPPTNAGLSTAPPTGDWSARGHGF